jgi:hypothetical protein
LNFLIFPHSIYSPLPNVIQRSVHTHLNDFDIWQLQLAHCF